MAFTDFSCVYYDDGDKLGKLLAYAALIPYVLILFHASAFYCRRDIHEAVIFAGLVLNEGVARALKHLLAHPRPPATCAKLDLCDEFGMPSSHTQCIAFAFAVHALLCARGFALKSLSTRLVEGFESIALLVATAMVATSRVYLGYHELEQVAAGACLGMLLGAATYATLSWKLWAGIASSPLGRFFHLKSTLTSSELDRLELEARFYRKLKPE
ncbi:hypothetical protein CHLRE_06g272400v5 [Chlamydomonas reinhardtii]|uniref:Phosphatidic acid phosphatase type 2/haloperoxidase domain-containing protein n=1 Tax=Chlamydomonas reinhardtii TaxID=3055 RepID=A0A2K3DNF9_CHLRE|nr:uncharacterized protein CHLRE_06g272400v5 [Chlamydomonas reinhardtii]PNW82067.1 hypothetical protein CHLRE_06g272400v5 [Chlamydomonas reinhardtii]